MADYLKIANDPILWLMCLPAVAMVGIQAYIFSRQAFRSSSVTNLTKEQCKRAFKIGAVSAIGPAIAVFIVMLGMMAVVGGPITWLRLSFIGAAPTELTASTMGAKAMGVEFGSPEYDITAFAASVWTMILNGCGWILFCGLFTHKLESLRHKIAGGDVNLMGQIGGAATLGTMAYLTTDHLLAGGGRFIATIAAGIAMAVLVKVSEKVPAIREYNLGLAMLVGMFAAVLV